MIQFAQLCLQRPVLALVLNLLVVLAGAMAYERLTVREYPQIDPPVVTVATTYRGASAAIMESTVTQVLEDSLSGIEGIDIMTSSSRAQSSQISITFLPSRDIDTAASDVRDRVSRARRELPESIDEPVITKAEADAQPIMWLALSSDQHDGTALSVAADRTIKDRLQALPGVADIRIGGERRPAMRIWLDAERLQALSLGPPDVEQALRTQNLELPAGRLDGDLRELSVLTRTNLTQPEEFAQIIVSERDGHLVRLGDVARIERGVEDVRRTTRYNGREGVGVGIIRLSTANPLTVSEAVRAQLPNIEAQLPEGMKLTVAFDSSVFIDASIRSVAATLIEATVLVVLVIFVFLRTLRATWVPLVAIPVSLIGALVFMQAFGLSLNTLTLLAMVLAIGLVVDDAIVVLENIYRHIEEGMTPAAAAKQGISEIAFAVLAMTLTLVAVFAPLAFSEGRTGQLFAEFALTLAAAVLVSGFCALTLSPMLCARLLKKPTGIEPAWSARLGRFFDGAEQRYQRLLTRILPRAGWITASVVGLMVGCWGLVQWLPSELSPVEDRGVIINMGIGPEGATPAYLDPYTRQVESIYQALPGWESTFMITGVPDETRFMSFNRFVPWSERPLSTQAMAPQLAQQLADVPGVQAIPVLPPSLGASNRSSPIEFVVQTTASYQDLGRVMEQLLALAEAQPGLVNPVSDLRLNKPELAIDVDRERAALAGVQVAQVSAALESFLGGRVVGRFNEGSDQYDVIVQIEDAQRRGPADLERLFLRNDAGEMVSLASVVTVTDTVSPSSLGHVNKRRSATLSASLAPGYAQGDAVVFLQDALRSLNNPSLSYDWTGPTREFLQAGATLSSTFVLALLFIYLLLSAQFESFRHPVIILLTVPLAMLGALGALKLTGGSLNVYSQVGLITLIGLITKHGILIVEFANQRQANGQDRLTAVIEASAQRLRPILMTAGTMVLGALPLALASGAGAEVRQSIGWVIVGGMTLGTILALLVVPAAYLALTPRPRPSVTPT